MGGLPRRRHLSAEGCQKIFSGQIFHLHRRHASPPPFVGLGLSPTCLLENSSRWKCASSHSTQPAFERAPAATLSSEPPLLRHGDASPTVVACSVLAPPALRRHWWRPCRWPVLTASRVDDGGQLVLVIKDRRDGVSRSAEGRGWLHVSRRQVSSR